MKTMLNKANMKSLTYVTILPLEMPGDAGKNDIKHDGSLWGFSFEIRVFISCVYHGNGRKHFVKRMSNSIL